MLRDVRLQQTLPSVMMDMMGIAPRRLSEGVYDGCGFNFHICLPHGEYEQWSHPDDVPAYGVADSVEQFMSLYGEKLRASPHAYAVGFTTVKKSEQGAEGGWRWHKWGPYVGTKEPTAEYLHDEPEIEEVVTFSVVRRKEARP